MVSFCDSYFWSVHHRADIVKTYWGLEVLGNSNQVVGDPFLVPDPKLTSLIPGPGLQIDLPYTGPETPDLNPYTCTPRLPFPDPDVMNPYTGIRHSQTPNVIPKVAALRSEPAASRQRPP